MNKKIGVFSLILVLLVVSGCDKNYNAEIILEQKGDVIIESTGDTNIQETGNFITDEAGEITIQDIGTNEEQNQIIETWDRDQLINKETIADSFGFQLEKRHLKTDLGSDYIDYLGSLIIGGKIYLKESCNIGAEDDNGDCPTQEIQKYVFINVDKSSNKELYNMTGIVLVGGRIQLGCVQDLPELSSYINTPVLLKIDINPFGGYGFGPGDCRSPVLNTEIYNGDISMENFY